MSDFIQLHLLTSYPPSNLNRDDLGRPKTAVIGGSSRLRISSQSLKRAWRTSDLFEQIVGLRGGVRSRELARKISQSLQSGALLSDLILEREQLLDCDGLIAEGQADAWAREIAAVYVDKKAKADGGDDESGDEGDVDEGKKKAGKSKGKKGKSNISLETLKSEQLVFYSRPEIEAIEQLIVLLRKPSAVLAPENLSKLMLDGSHRTADLAMFGRMLANAAKFNVEAAVQVAHAFTVHKVQVEDDYFTAIDDLNRHEEDAGAGHLGETGFGAGLFYLYLCIDKSLLLRNLGGDLALADRTLRALLECATTVAPTGKQNSFASRAHALFCLAERGSQQPRSLALAFTRALKGDDVQDLAIGELLRLQGNLDQVYGPRYRGCARFDVLRGEGSLQALADFIAG